MASRRKEQSCPICCEMPRDMAHALPCCHHFCLGCILRWVRAIHTCPLCRTLISAISFSEQEEDCLQCIIRHPREAASHAGNADGSRDGRSTRGLVTSLASASPGTPSPAEQGAAGPEAVGGILPELWAELFRRRWSLLSPVRAWLQQHLRKIYREQWWQTRTVESSILLILCIFGPDREVLLQQLRPRLQCYTALLVHGTLGIIETQCSRDVHRLWGCHAAPQEDESPADGSSPSARRGDAPTSGVEHEAGASGFLQQQTDSLITVREEQTSTENPRGPGFVRAEIQTTLEPHSRRVVGPAPSTDCLEENFCG
ncbi:hypothetical protein RLOC_00000158 [Lonchura striata]|uniref:RING-type domain-containing protein n=1 Tax=Lonchura striata TaxID=40157 RepID=A0A218V1P5_9PASE|nr:hypothetical protein RLOC_00000158 [Lonchura striata domestica]